MGTKKMTTFFWVGDDINAFITMNVQVLPRDQNAKSLANSQITTCVR